MEDKEALRMLLGKGTADQAWRQVGVVHLLPFKACSKLSFSRNLLVLIPVHIDSSISFWHFQDPHPRKPSNKMCIKIKPMKYYFIF